MNVLNKNQHANSDAADKGDDFIPLLIKTKKEQKLGRSMPGVEEIFGNEVFAIKRIAQRVDQRNEAWWRIERDKRDGNKAGTQKNTERTKKQHRHVWVAGSFD